MLACDICDIICDSNVDYINCRIISILCDKEMHSLACCAQLCASNRVMVLTAQRRIGCCCLPFVSSCSSGSEIHIFHRFRIKSDTLRDSYHVSHLLHCCGPPIFLAIRLERACSISFGNVQASVHCMVGESPPVEIKSVENHDDISIHQESWQTQEKNPENACKYCHLLSW